MGFFDNLATNLSDPNNQALLGFFGGMANGFGQAAMPSATPVPLGAALSSGFGGGFKGATEGVKNSQAIRSGQADLTGKTIGNDQALILENILRKALGKPELTQDDLSGAGARSPLFGLPTLNGKAATPAPAAVPGATTDDATASPGGTAGGPQGDGGGMGGMLVNKLLGFAPTDYQKAKLAADIMPPGPAKVQAERAAAKLAGVDITLSQRAGEASSLWNPETGKYDEVSRNPNLSPDLDYDPNTKTASIVPGALEGLGALETVRRGAAAQFEPLDTYDKAGNETIVPRTALQTGLPGATQPPPVSPYAARVAQLESGGQPDATNPNSTATGADQFTQATWLDQAKKYLPPEITKGRTDDQLLALRTNPQVSAFLTNRYAMDNNKALTAAGIKNVGPAELYMAHHFGPQGASAILKAPVNTPLSAILPKPVMDANPDLANATVADIYASASHAMRGVGGSAAAAAQNGVAPPAGPKAPNTPVANSASDIPNKLDDFLGKLGPQYQPPGRPDTPAGALMGEPGKGTEEIQKLDGDRLEQYSKEAAGGQKVYTNLQQLYQIMGRGLSTGNMTNAATHLTNYAQQMGFGRLVPKDFDPNDAGAFNKLATDLVFAQLKQIGGRPMVSEIEGLKQANPNTSLTPAANVEILNNILADQRWRDSRADLGRQYMARFGSLGDFDARFNQLYPETDTLNRITDAAAKAGWKMPGDASTPSGAASGRPAAAAPKAPAIDPAAQAKITPEAIAATAKKYGHTIDQVKQNLRARGYTVP